MLHKHKKLCKNIKENKLEEDMPIMTNNMEKKIKNE